jgi:hypothetical protein
MPRQISVTYADTVSWITSPGLHRSMSENKNVSRRTSASLYACITHTHSLSIFISAA